MITDIESIILEFRQCFSRKAAFYWFVLIIFGFIVRCDHYGTTSFIRWLFLPPEAYDPMLRFFRASSWELATLLEHWQKIVINRYPVIKFEGRALLIGDGIKVSKEAKKMPAVKSLHQDSENSGKAQYIRGHHFGYVGLLVGSLGKAFCLPLQGELHEGVQHTRPAEGFEGKPATLVTRMARLVVQQAKQTGLLYYATLDAYFSTGPAFSILKEAVNENKQRLVHLITRAKDNYVGYFYSETPQGKLQKKNKVSLRELFDHPQFFEKVELTVYGQVKEIKYLCVNLLWAPINDIIRFVCVMDKNNRYVLMCSDIDLHPTQVITIYSYRCKIEVMFLVLKRLIGGFYYRFWAKALPKLKRGKTLDYSKLDEKVQESIDRTLDAIERFINLAGIALGVLQYLSLTRACQIWKNYQGWLRTYSSELPSEEVVKSVVQAEFFSSIGKVLVSPTLPYELTRLPEEEETSIGKVPISRTLQIIQAKGRQRSMKIVEPLMDIAT